MQETFKKLPALYLFYKGIYCRQGDICGQLGEVDSKVSSNKTHLLGKVQQDSKTIEYIIDNYQQHIQSIRWNYKKDINNNDPEVF